MEDQLDSVIDEAMHSQPQPGATGVGVREELQTLTDVAAGAAPPAVAGVAQRPLLSRKGEVWDARQHVSPPDQTARGTWRKLLGASLSPVSAVEVAPVPATVAPPVSPVDAARDVCAMLFDSGAPLMEQLCPLDGEVGWEPSAAERGNVERQLTRFYERYPEYAGDIPPGVALLLAVGAYALPRVMQIPQVRDLIKRKKPTPAATMQEVELRNAA